MEKNFIKSKYIFNLNKNDHEKNDNIEITQSRGQKRTNCKNM